MCWTRKKGHLKKKIEIRIFAKNQISDLFALEIIMSQISCLVSVVWVSVLLHYGVNNSSDYSSKTILVKIIL